MGARPLSVGAASWSTSDVPSYGAPNMCSSEARGA
jgi:hypothetical protein